MTGPTKAEVRIAKRHGMTAAKLSKLAGHIAAASRTAIRPDDAAKLGEIADRLQALAERVAAEAKSPGCHQLS